ncbi:MAG: leucine-rich repeat domain-containing protein [Lachnospiraceae bacterium]|nr:leucine-rich repeat domain-containing protein [Lachnospiraceae bacterium]
MKRRALLTKATAVILSAAMVASGSGITVLADTTVAQESAEQISDGQIAPEEDAASDEATEAKEDEKEEGKASKTEADRALAPAPDFVISDETAEFVPGSGEVKTDDVREEKADDEKESTAEVDGDQHGEAVQDEAEESDDSAAEVEEEEIASESRSTNMSDPLSRYVRDGVLLDALTALYNDAKGTNVDKAAITIGNIAELESVELTSSNTVLTDASISVSGIKSIEGLGYATGATVIDVSQTGITAIPESEFIGLTKLGRFVMSDNITSIGKSAFQGCIALTTVHVVTGGTESTVNTLPSNLQNKGTGSNLFSGCTALTQFTLPALGANNGAALQDATSLLGGCTALNSVTIPAGITVLPAYCFAMQCTEDLEEGPDVPLTVEIESGSKLATIGEGCFQYSNLKELDLSMCSKLSLISQDAFCADKDKSWGSPYVCKEPLEKLRLPANLSGSLEIGKDAFYRTNLSSLYTSTDNGKVYLPDYVTKLGEGAFFQDKVVTEVRLSKNLTSLECSVFDGCEKLATVVAEEGIKVEKICDHAFFDTAITDATFIGNMTLLERFGEHKDPSVTTEISDGIRGAGQNTEDVISYNYSQEYCYGVAPVGTVSPVRGSVFNGDNLTTITFPSTLRKISSLSMISVHNLGEVKVKAVPAKSKYNIEKADKFVIEDAAFAFNSALTSFEYPAMGNAKTTEFMIGNAAFDLCVRLKEFTEAGKSHDATKNAMPAVLKRLGWMSFDECLSLPSMAISNRPDGTAPELGFGAFAYCLSLESATLPMALTEIPDSFYYDAGLTGTTIPGNPAVITEIGDGAFFGNSFYPSVDLSAWTKLNRIGDVAFAYFDPKNGETGYRSDNYAAYLVKLINKEIEAGIPSQFPYMPEKIILPDVVSGTGNLILGEGAFRTNRLLYAIETKSVKEPNTAVFPTYIRNADCGSAAVAETAIAKAKWLYAEKAGADRAVIWAVIPGSMFMGCNNVKNIKDCLPKGDYLKQITEIGPAAFFDCAGLTSIDLRNQNGFENLTETGEKCFSDCESVTEVFLPDNGKYTTTSREMFQTGNNDLFLTSGGKFQCKLRNINFGKVKVLGEYTFACCNTAELDGQKLNKPWPSALKEIKIPATITEIGQGAFQGHISDGTTDYPGLTKVTFENPGSKENPVDLKIGEYAFGYNYQLVMSDSTPLPDRLTEIGSYAFSDCYSLGKVVFGTGIRSIGVGAFQKTLDYGNGTFDGRETVVEEHTDKGLKQVDFSKAKNLKTIERDAFSYSALETVDLSPTSLDTLDSYVFASCPLLHTVSLGSRVGAIADESMSGCPSLNRLEVYATSTIMRGAFNSEGVFGSTNVSPAGGFSIVVKSDPVTVPIGLEMAFPYNLSVYDLESPSIMPMHVGKETDTVKDPSIQEYFKVIASEPYYRYTIESENLIKEPYYQKITNEDEKHRELGYGRDVCTFRIKGLKKTSKPIDFVIQNTLSLLSGGNKVQAKFSADFKVEVSDVNYFPRMLQMNEEQTQTSVHKMITCNESTGMSSANTTLDITANRQSMDVYYDILPTAKNTTAIPSQEAMKLVVMTSNSDVIGIDGTNAEFDKTASGELIPSKCVIPAREEVSVLEEAVKGNYVTLDFKKCGKATITMYLAGYPNQKVIWNFNLFADVESIGLSVPQSITEKGGYEVGDTFSVLDSLSFYKHGTLSREEGNLNNWRSLTRAKLQFISSDPGTASIDANGVVKILNVTAEPKEVQIRAQAANSDGSIVECYALVLQMALPSLDGSKPIVMKDLGGSLTITQTPDAFGNGATASFTSVQEGQANVTIPSDVTIYGRNVKITEIAADAFKDNKTVQSVIIGANVETLPEGVFSGCTALKDVTIQGNVKLIPTSAFEGCSSLTSVTMPNTVTEIGDKAFMKCKKLIKIVIPKKVKSIGTAAFKGCSKLKTVTFEKKSVLKTIGDEAFMSCTSLTKMNVISTKFKSLGASAFEKDKKLKTISFKSTKIKTVGDNAFKKIHKKAVIKLPKKKFKAQKELFTGKGQGKKVKIKKG